MYLSEVDNKDASRKIIPSELDIIVYNDNNIDLSEGLKNPYSINRMTPLIFKNDNTTRPLTYHIPINDSITNVNKEYTMNITGVSEEPNFTIVKNKFRLISRDTLLNNYSDKPDIINLINLIPNDYEDIINRRN
jgi:hypothetical protein